MILASRVIMSFSCWVRFHKKKSCPGAWDFIAALKYYYWNEGMLCDSQTVQQIYKLINRFSVVETLKSAAGPPLGPFRCAKLVLNPVFTEFPDLWTKHSTVECKWAELTCAGKYSVFPNWMYSSFIEYAAISLCN